MELSKELLQELREAAIADRGGQAKERWRETINKCSKALGIKNSGSPDSINACLDWLDIKYPGWRGYRPRYVPCSVVILNGVPIPLTDKCRKILAIALQGKHTAKEITAAADIKTQEFHHSIRSLEAKKLIRKSGSSFIKYIPVNGVEILYPCREEVAA